MLEIHTSRLAIRETDNEAIKPISEKNMASAGSNILSDLTEDDIKIIFEEKEELSALVAKLQSYNDAKSSKIYGIWFDSTLIGYVGLKNFDEPIPEIQIEFDPRYHHQGYGYEALSAMVQHFFDQGIKCLRYVVIPTNKASIALVEKIGGQLQPPGSNVERILLRTYHIPAPSGA